MSLLESRLAELSRQKQLFGEEKMSSKEEGQEVTFTCDVEGCEETYVASGRWKDVWEAAKESGWRGFKNEEEEWEHRCPDHRGH